MLIYPENPLNHQVKYVLSDPTSLQSSHVTKGTLPIRPSPPRPSAHSPFNIFTATVTASFGLSLSIPTASAMTTCPKQPSPRGLPSVSLSLGNSHFGSSGNSYSETPASIGVSAVEDRRVVILTSGVLEFMEELDSAETVTCLRRGMRLVSLCTAGWLLKSGFLVVVFIRQKMTVTTMQAIKKTPMQ